ncbi:class I SAM-dependent methyltransferase [Kineococcus sp. SYSU DK003]|uniref:class I SAM-dependent methyltransferase n=1 Tax=Kineococcus sp. SYSU DK003 TaxID=3383124 RepID=UPI003D7CF381
MPDALFAHPRLAALYDAFNDADDGSRPDLEPYVARAGELGASRVLDVGCGTGRLVALLVAAGFDVVGADPAAASLRIARQRPGTAGVRWLELGADGLPALEADLAVMTGNVAQVFTTDEAWDAALRGVARALRPGGAVVFETRRPDAQAWRRWEEPVEEVRDVPGAGRVEHRFELTGVALPLVSFRDTFTFADGERLTSTSTLRFRDLPELRDSLERAGFSVADVRQAPDRPGLEFVVTAARLS